MANQRSDICPNCNNMLRPGARFCPHCGYAIPAAAPERRDAPGSVCSHCGASYRPGAKFCPGCGRPLGTPLPAAFPSPPQPPYQANLSPARPVPAPPPAYPPLARELTPAPAVVPERSGARRPLNRRLIAALAGLILLLALAITFVLTTVDKPVPPSPTPNVAATLTAVAKPLNP